MSDATTFSLRDLLNAYHEKCRELDEIKRINGLLIEQNEKLIESNYESERVGELEHELKESDLIIEDLKAECSELRRDLDRERSFDRTKQAYRDTLKYPSVDSNRFEPAYTGSYHIRWDDYKTGG
jgi:hypothetical protein